MTDFVRSITFRIPGKSSASPRSQTLWSTSPNSRTDRSCSISGHAAANPPISAGCSSTCRSLDSVQAEVHRLRHQVHGRRRAGYDLTWDGANMKGKGHPTFDVGVEFGTPGKHKKLRALHHRRDAADARRARPRGVRRAHDQRGRSWSRSRPPRRTRMTTRSRSSRTVRAGSAIPSTDPDPVSFRCSPTIPMLTATRSSSPTSTTDRRTAPPPWRRTASP